MMSHQKISLSSSKPLRPYRQGDLDALCGLYTVINSIRWCLRDYDIAKQGPHWMELFAELSDYAVKEIGHLSISSMGLGLNAMIWLMRTAQEHMRTVHGINIRTKRPFALSKPSELNQPALAIENHLQNDSSSTLFAIYGSINHWSVATEITATRAKLFDSDGLNYLPIKSFQNTDFNKKNKETSTIQTGSLICLQLDGN